MRLTFQGAADGVTGSLHRLEAGAAEILLDCGLFQGHRQDSNRRNRSLPAWAPRAQAAVLSHAHLDHSGNLPTLVKAGFQGNIYCTPATRDLCSVMLRDAAMIQKQDARYLNRRRDERGDKPVEPLYDVDDAYRAVEHMIAVPYRRPIPIAEGATLTFHDAGHVLGSSLVCLDLHEGGASSRLLYTGDLGRAELPLLRDPEIVPDVDTLLMECTYGDREHPDVGVMTGQLGAIIRDTIERKGRVLIPAFALERAQELLFALSTLIAAGDIPQVPIYVDSPLAIAVTEIYKLHPDGLDEDVRQRMLSRDDPFSPPGLSYISSVEDSKALQASGQPCIVIAGSGMCEGGRILYHFVRGLGDARNSVVIVGFMAQHTLGRRLAEGRREVRVLGVMRDVRAQLHSLRGLSAHADRRGLLAFARATAAAGSLRRIALVHGEDEAKRSFATELREQLSCEIVESSPGQEMALATSGAPPR